MARCYFDTSALVKDYHVESGSLQVRAILGTPGSEIFISRLGAVEMLSGFAGKVRAGVLTGDGYDAIRKRFFADVRRKSLRPLRILNVHYQIAGDLIGEHAMVRPLRTLDAIPLAVALHFHRSFPLDHFVCADRRLCDVARLEGLSVIQP